MVDYPPVVWRNFSSRQAPSGVVLEDVVPTDVRTRPLEADGEIRLMVESIELGLFRDERISIRFRTELVDAFEIPENRNEMPDEVIDFMAYRQLELDSGFSVGAETTARILVGDEVRVYVDAPFGVPDNRVKIFASVRALAAQMGKTVVSVMSAVVSEETEVFKYVPSPEERGNHPFFNW